MERNDGAQLELRLVGKLSGRFLVESYQRGYRWGEVEVTKLLEDIWQNVEKPYCLQPVVVKRLGEGEWELVDGQQRLTTLFLIFHYFKESGLKNVGPPFSLAYRTRLGSEDYLLDLDSTRRETNIDFYHLHGAHDCIRRWFEDKGGEQQVVADEFYRALYRFVNVIWYEAPSGLDSISLFTRLNVGRIPLTNAELVKALILSHSRHGAGGSDRANETAAQWDSIERDLRVPAVWDFVAGGTEDVPTHISLLLDTVAGGPRGRMRPIFHTFEVIARMVRDSSWEEVWNRVLDLHSLVLGWYENRSLYHKVGYLVATETKKGEEFAKLVALAEGKTKSSFDALLDDRIRARLGMTRSDVEELSYETDKGRDGCHRILLLMNVETVRRMEHSSERYSFGAHWSGSWSLEHIHAQNTEHLNKAEQWTEWLRLHRSALSDFPADEERRDGLVAKIDSELANVSSEGFHRLAGEVSEFFSRHAGEAGLEAGVWLHSISNLALLPRDANSALGNSVFEVKRRRILELDRKGEYIPVATRQAFLKYFAEANVQQIHFWSIQDRKGYLNAILSPTLGIGAYLMPEEGTECEAS
jgi:hypothetical protein